LALGLRFEFLVASSSWTQLRKCNSVPSVCLSLRDHSLKLDAPQDATPCAAPQAAKRLVNIVTNHMFNVIANVMLKE
jgi:hypothetical protein